MPAPSPPPSPPTRTYATLSTTAVPSPVASPSPPSSSPIWGSASPASSRASSPSQPLARNVGGRARARTDETLSELPALVRRHEAEGYRAGVAEGSANSELAQTGFDAGYAVGAVWGMRVGWVRGALRELVRLKGGERAGGGQVGGGSVDVGGTETLRALEEKAKRELRVDAVLRHMEEEGNGKALWDEETLMEVPPRLLWWCKEVETRARVLGMVLEYPGP